VQHGGPPGALQLSRAGPLRNAGNILSG